MTIPYATTNELLPRYLAMHLEPAGYRLVPYADNLSTNSLSVIILFSPMFLNDRYVSPDAVWQKYFKIRTPNLRLISAGFAGPVHPNYLELSEISTDFDDFLSQALPVSADMLPLNTGGQDMAAKLGRFFEGHGAESIWQVFNALQRAAAVIAYLQSQPGGEQNINNAYFGLDSDLIQRWQRFSLRWKVYSPFWNCLPVISLFNNIDNHVKILDQVFNLNTSNLKLYNEFAVPDRLAEMHQIFKEIEKIIFSNIQ